MNPKEQWQQYCEEELSTLRPLLVRHGFFLNNEQPHLKGERYLQRAITTESGKKLILYGTSANGDKVVIKATRDRAGQNELTHERACRKFLHDIDFAATAFKTPPEVAWIEEDGFVVGIQLFIEQPRTFLEHTLPEQFDIALSSFKAQEGTHATTYGHIHRIKKTYEIRTEADYLRNFADFICHTNSLLPQVHYITTQLEQTKKILDEHSRTILQYCGFLTHTDFVPHNLRIAADETIYLLDHSSLTFGNKHEGWARFLNFMALYNPELTSLLTKYIQDNRAPEEQESLWLMRLYRLGEIIFYYAKAQASSEGELRELNRARVVFWSTMLKQVLRHEELPPEIIRTYQTTRDRLRSEDEKDRQKGLH